jgi:hypothetical protein
MAFTGNEDHSISIDDAALLTSNYRDAEGEGAFLGGYFSKSALNKILTQSGCVGIRIYNARAESGDPTFVLVGVDPAGEDLTGGELAEFATGCPPFCPKTSELTGTV